MAGPDPATTEWVPMWSASTPTGVLFAHVQSPAALTWVITHNLGVIGYAVTITDDAGVVVLPNTITHTSPNVITVTFKVAQAGKAYVLGGVSMTAQTPGAHRTTHEPGGADAIAALAGEVLTSGTVPDARLSSNVPMKNAANTFTQSPTVSADFASLFLSHPSAAVDQRLFRIMCRGTLLEFEAASDNGNTQFTALQLARNGNVTIPKDLTVTGALNGLFLKLMLDATYNDAAAHSLGYAHNRIGVLVLSGGSSGNSSVPFFCSGGGGVAYRWTVLDPDTGWLVNWNGAFSFTEPGSSPSTFLLTLSGAQGTMDVARTAGTAAYRVRLYAIDL